MEKPKESDSAVLVHFGPGTDGVEPGTPGKDGVELAVDNSGSLLLRGFSQEVEFVARNEVIHTSKMQEAELRAEVIIYVVIV